MKRIRFHDNWYVKRENGHHGGYNQEERVTLPHDAMISTIRTKDSWNGTKKAFFENGVWEYRKEFELLKEWKGKKLYLEFEGVYMNASVYINNCFAGQHIYGYTEFTFEISHLLKEGMNEVKVIVRTDDDSRWYSGAGIYRNVNLLVGESVHISNNGVLISTPVVSENRAQVIITTKVENHQWNDIVTVQVLHEIRDMKGRLVAKSKTPITLDKSSRGTDRQRITIENPFLWDIEHPALYRCMTKIMQNENVLDESEDRFGIRSIEIDAKEGFLLNGRSMKLRGACVHHDNGVIGARAIYAATYRKVKKLKEAGFQAIRISHHPADRATLAACDELGVLVMDETFDVWKKHKSSHDYAMYFEQNWESDVEAMVRKDYNHPCVVMYSIGNEIPDAENAIDAAIGRKIVEKIHSIDTSRFTTNAINGILLIMNKMDALAMEGTEINQTMASMEDMIKIAVNMPFMDEAIEEVCSQVDIAGYNYMADRYEADLEKYPNRIIVGSETYPKDIYRNWQWVKKLPNVIGDFTWTGWDYLGETGIGKVTYDEEINTFGGFYGDYPYITARCGDFDITGFRLPISYYREIVYGIRKEPYIAVSRPQMSGKKMDVSVWGWSDVINSWNFEGYEGTPLTVEVYTASDEIELFVNGKSQGRKILTQIEECKVIYDVIYEKGCIEAVSYIGGIESGRYALYSSEKNKILKMQTEKEFASLKEQDLIFVNLSITDEDGILFLQENPLVELEVDGEGVLLGFGNGAFMTEENYVDMHHTMHDGRAFAVILPTGIGSVTVKAAAEGYDAVTIRIPVKE